MTPEFPAIDLTMLLEKDWSNDLHFHQANESVQETGNKVTPDAQAAGRSAGPDFPVGSKDEDEG